MTMQSYNSGPRYQSTVLPDWLNPDNNVQPAAVENMGLGGAGTDFSSFNAPMAQLSTTPSSGMNPIQEALKNWGILGSTDKNGIHTDGMGSLGLGVANSLFGAYTAMQQLKLGKETLANNKAQYAQNFAAQQKTTNAALSDRQAARVASNPTAYQSVGEYMKKNGI